MSSLPKPLGQLWIYSHSDILASTRPLQLAIKIAPPMLSLGSHKSRARGSVDRASGSGPEDRGFESLRAHI
jgi:hypothetical protein